MYDQRWREMHGGFLEGVRAARGELRKGMAESRDRATLGMAMAQASQHLKAEVETIDAATAAAAGGRDADRRALGEHAQHFVRGRLTQEVVDTLLDEKAGRERRQWGATLYAQIPANDQIATDQAARLNDLQRPGLAHVLRVEAALRPDERLRMQTAREQLTGTSTTTC
eukprot:SAG22_NODE_7526_length_731_cov_1.344937_1_plen_168_part_10